MKIRVYFTASNTIGGAAIRFLTFSRWNHVAIEIDDYVYEALLSGGVQKTKAYDYNINWKRTTLVDIDIPGLNKEAAKNFLESQLGKPYDWKALFALPFRTDWQDNDSWFCSELVAEALIVSGLYQFNIGVSRFTPRDLFLILSNRILREF